MSHLLRRRSILSNGVSETYSESILNDSPDGFWMMNESSGTQMTDTSGNTRHGTYVNTPTLGSSSCIPTTEETSVTFDDSNDEHALVPWFFHSDLTVEVALARGSVGSTHYIIGQTNYTSNTAWVLRLGSGGDLTIDAWTTGDGNIWVSGPVLTQDQDYHIAATYETDVGLKLYVDGLQYGSTTTGSGTIVDASTDLSMAGSTNASFLFPYDGKLQGAAVWNSTLTAAQISRHARAGGFLA